MTLTYLRKQAMILNKYNIVPPYYLRVEPHQLQDISHMTGYIPVRFYRGKVDVFGSAGHYEIGAIEGFRIVVRDRRKQERRRK